MTTTSYAMQVQIPVPYGDAETRVRDELAREGFGVITNIDMQATLKQKLDLDFRPYVILGACNPPLAHKALSEELEIGLLLPCNVVVYEGDDPTTSVVLALDPTSQLELSDNPNIEPMAQEVRARLQRVLERVAG